MDASRFYCAYVDYGDWDMIDRPFVDGYHWNISNHGDDNINSSSKIDPSSLDPSSSSNDESTSCTPSMIGSPQGAGTIILSSFIQTLTILIEGLGGTSGNNSDFSVNAISDAIHGNEDCIPQASVHVNQNQNSMGF